jgi:RNA recognition motif-containing protein
LEESATAAIATMNNYNYDGRALTVKRANLRGGEAAKRDSEANSWKSIPTPSPLERKKAVKKDAAIKAKTGVAPKVTKRPTWDNWVGPAEVPVKAASKPKPASVPKPTQFTVST